MRFIYSYNGGVAICVAASKKDLERVLGKLTDEEYREHVLSRSLPEGVSRNGITFVSDDWTPSFNRTFRNAWELKEGEIIVSMPKARDLQRDKIRAERGPELTALDVAFMRSIEQREPTEGIVRRKQALRDAPAHPSIELAKTPDELSVITLKSLLKD